MNQLKKYIAILFLVGTTACGKVSDETDILKLNSTPVVFSLITPGEMAQVTLSRSVISDEVSDTIYYPEARVYMCEKGNEWHELVRLPTGSAQFADTCNQLIITEGKTYLLKIDLAHISLTAQTTVPSTKGVIKSFVFTTAEPNPKLDYLTGNIAANISLPAKVQCIMSTPWETLTDDNSIFITSENVNYTVSIPLGKDSFRLRLITLDKSLGNYLLATELNHLKSFYTGDMAPFIGSYNGLLPPYSNINNGLGLFAAYVCDTKTVNIPNP